MWLILLTFYTKACCLLDNDGLFNVAWIGYKNSENRFGTRGKVTFTCFLNVKELYFT